MEQTKFKRFKRIAEHKILVILMTFMLSMGSISLGYSNPIDISANIENTINQLTKDNIEKQLIEEVAKYVNKYAPKANKVIPKYLVHAGLTNNIDICFMMAQTQIETSFGTAGAGREVSRRSMFGVINRHYPNYEEAINHYCQILKKYYLVKGRTEQHLMVKYVTGSGARYAGAPGYEKALTAAYNHIKRTTSVYSLQERYKAI